jgi:hypothetical protein
MVKRSSTAHAPRSVLAFVEKTCTVTDAVDVLPAV